MHPSYTLTPTKKKNWLSLLERYSTRWRGRGDSHKNLGVQSAYLKNIFLIWETQYFPAQSFLTYSYSIYIINIHKMNHSSLIFWHFFQAYFIILIQMFKTLGTLVLGPGEYSNGWNLSYYSMKKYSPDIFRSVSIEKLRCQPGIFIFCI